ncbi:MAG: class I SAM-dependent methyltransferase [Polyangiaceae bacterium]
MTAVDLGRYAAEYSAQYESEDWFETVLVHVRREEVLNALGKHPHASVLEIGCGLEPLFPFVRDFQRWVVIEPVPSFVECARRAALTHARGARVEVLEGFVETREHELTDRGPFDYVVASSVLHEVPDPRRLLAALRQLSGPETRIHVNVPNVRSLHRLLALEAGLISDVFAVSEMERRFQRSTRFDAETLRATCEAAGFRVEELWTYFLKPFTHSQMARLVDARVVSRPVVEALARMTRYVPDLGAEIGAQLRRS